MTWSKIWRGDSKRLSKFERTLENREVWGIGDLKIKVENEEVTGKGDLTIMKRWHKKSTFKALAFMSKKSWILGGFCCLESNLLRFSDFIHLCMQISFLAMQISFLAMQITTTKVLWQIGTLHLPTYSNECQNVTNICKP